MLYIACIFSISANWWAFLVNKISLLFIYIVLPWIHTASITLLSLWLGEPQEIKINPETQFIDWCKAHMYALGDIFHAFKVLGRDVLIPFARWPIFSQGRSYASVLYQQQPWDSSEYKEFYGCADCLWSFGSGIRPRTATMGVLGSNYVHLYGRICWNHDIPHGVLRCSLSEEPSSVIASMHCADNQCCV